MDDIKNIITRILYVIILFLRSLIFLIIEEKNLDSKKQWFKTFHKYDNCNFQQYKNIAAYVFSNFIPYFSKIIKHSFSRKFSHQRKLKGRWYLTIAKLILEKSIIVKNDWLCFLDILDMIPSSQLELENSKMIRPSHFDQAI